MSNKKYITTTLPYINSKPHIGHALELVQADTLARFFSWYIMSKGDDVHFNSGLDEHGLKVYQSAISNGLTPKEHCDKLAEEWHDFYFEFHIEPTTFYRTSRSLHHENVQIIWKTLLEKGDIYKKDYTSKYCIGCEEFKRDVDLVEGKCKIHPKTELETVSEENYFFRLSNYKEELLVWFENTKDDFIHPSKYKNELKYFLEGIEDISISRDSKKVSWGVVVPDDNTQTIYVWFDALLNYILSAGYLTDDFDWNDTVQLCGADNIRFQAVIFQGMLCSLGIKNTGKLLVHGTVLDENGTKMSKSLGNVVCPVEQYEKYGLEAIRYYLVAGNPTFSNFGYSEETVKTLFNAHLCNGFGNLTKRVITLINKKNVNVVGTPMNSFTDEVKECQKNIHDSFKNLNIQLAYDYLHKLVNRTNQYLNDNEPWKLDDSEASIILKNCYYSLGWISVYYSFIFPNREDEISKVIEELDDTKILFERL